MRSVRSACTRGCLRGVRSRAAEEVGERYEQVDGDQLDAHEPVGGGVGGDDVGVDDRQGECEGRERVKAQREVVALRAQKKGINNKKINKQTNKQINKQIKCWKYTVIGYHFILVVYILIIYCLSTLLLIHTFEHSIQPMSNSGYILSQTRYPLSPSHGPA